jgi:hypothetical protein
VSSAVHSCGRADKNGVDFKRSFSITGCGNKKHQISIVVFSSHIFIYYFLPFALLVYYALFRARQRWRNAWLIVAGYTFYGWAEPAVHRADVRHNVHRLAHEPGHRA